MPKMERDSDRYFSFVSFSVKEKEKADNTSALGEIRWEKNSVLTNFVLPAASNTLCKVAGVK